MVQDRLTILQAFSMGNGLGFLPKARVTLPNFLTQIPVKNKRWESVHQIYKWAKFLYVMLVCCNETMVVVCEALVLFRITVIATQHIITIPCIYLYGTFVFCRF